MSTVLLGSILVFAAFKLTLLMGASVFFSRRSSRIAAGDTHKHICTHHH